jgi:HEPN domain-containing protein
MSADLVGEWLTKAEDNFISALALARRRNRPVYDVVCNQCQQCAEKYLKALLVRHDKTFPKTHDLTQLKNLIAAFEPDIKLIIEPLRVLDPYAIDVRYPGLQTTADDAREAVAAMKTIRKFIRAKLGLRSK